MIPTNYVGNNVSNEPYRQYDPTVHHYMHNLKRSWKTVQSGAYEAGPYTIPYQVRGKADAIPAMDLPGGPASPLSTGYKEYFARDKFNITLADWRGAGQARPLGGIIENTTEMLVEDIETLRRMNGYDKVLLRGGSWGASMAMRYAKERPEHVSGLVIGLPFLVRDKDIEWNFADTGVAQKYTEGFDRFMGKSGEKDWKGAVHSYADALIDPNPNVHKPAFVEWKKWEWIKCEEIYDRTPDDLDSNDERFQIELARARIMSHYFRNDFFREDKDGLVPALSEINKNVPIVVVTNECDAMTHPDTLDTMKEYLTNAEFVVNKGADWHWIFDPETDAKGRSNYFVENGYAYAVEKMRRMMEGSDLKLNPVGVAQYADTSPT